MSHPYRCIFGHRAVASFVPHGSFHGVGGPSCKGPKASVLSGDGALLAVVATCSALVSFVSHLLDAVFQASASSSKAPLAALVIATVVITHLMPVPFRRMRTVGARGA